MVKKKNNNIVLWILVILAVLILLNLNWSNPLISYQNHFVEKEKEGTNLGSNLGGGSETTLESKSQVNLCSSITPYVVLFDLENLCKSNGGAWVCSNDNIGCYKLNSPSLDCELGVIKTVLFKCTEKTATAYCDTINLYCKY